MSAAARVKNPSLHFCLRFHPEQLRGRTEAKQTASLKHLDGKNMRPVFRKRASDIHNPMAIFHLGSLRNRLSSGLFPAAATSFYV